MAASYPKTSPRASPGARNIMLNGLPITDRSSQHHNGRGVRTPMSNAARVIVNSDILSWLSATPVGALVRNTVERWPSNGPPEISKSSA